ncbi:hypothetical protein JHK82_055315 [Glycine max]|nr:hypothetical protein JHK86_055154 [Glycine max]KAG5076620.1 hypothetical protein JHK82_055315 [Glycine max]
MAEEQTKVPETMAEGLQARRGNIKETTTIVIVLLDSQVTNRESTEALHKEGAFRELGMRDLNNGSNEPRLKMPKHKTSKTVKPIESIPYPEVQTQPPQFLDLKIKAMEQEIVVIRASGSVEIEHLVTEVRLLCSCFSTEQLQKSLLSVFEETIPNLFVVYNVSSKKLQVTSSREPKTNPLRYRPV